jgi:hypothetical protein
MQLIHWYVSLLQANHPAVASPTRQCCITLEIHELSSRVNAVLYAHHHPCLFVTPSSTTTVLFSALPFSIYTGSSRYWILLRGRVGVHLPLASSHGDVDESAGVCDSLLRTALGRLLLLLWLDLMSQSSLAASSKEASIEDFCPTHLWCLRLDLSGTRQRSVNFTHDCGLVILGRRCPFCAQL